jgi:hypothetical protein
MSKVAITGNASGTGTFTIASPDSNSDRTLTLPDNSGTVQTELTNGFGFRNRIINGDMRIDQRNAGASVTLANDTATYTLDRWRTYENTDGVVAIVRDSAAPVGFNNSLKITVTTADASLASSQTAFINQSIEGFNVADLAWGSASAATITVSFWVRSSVTGVFGGCVRNSGTRSYPFTYTVNAANTWEQKTITVPGDTTGTWLTNNDIGLRVYFSVGDGGNTSGTANTWSDTGFTTATGQTNLLATLSATWQITGVQLEAGSVATPFERRPYGTELALCQRYYLDTTVAFSEFYNGNGINVRYSCNISFPTTMRAAPTITFSNISATLTDSDAAAFVSVNGFAYRSNMTATGVASRYSAARCTSEL